VANLKRDSSLFVTLILLKEAPMRKFFSFCLIAFIIFFAIPLSYAITAEEAGQHIGQNQTVCGTVASAHYRPYPNQIFTVLIWGNKRSLFSNAPERLYSGKRICVTGTITSYRGTPEIVVNSPGQIKE
jgi:hypothetical protein